MSTAAQSAPASAESVLSHAVVQAAQLLALRQSTLAQILGISSASASRLCGGTYLLSQARAKEWELAVLLVRVFRSLDALVGHGEPARLWLNAYNTALAARPLELLVTTEGLVRVLTYLDAYRGRI